MSTAVVALMTSVPSLVMLSPLTARSPARVTLSSRLTVTCGPAAPTVVILVPPTMVKVSA